MVDAGLSQAGFVPPPYPHDRLDAFRRLAAVVPGGVVDCSIGNPVDPVPDVVLAALEAAAAWITRRLGAEVSSDHVLACIGTKEMVASLPRFLGLRNPGRDTVLYPA